MSEQQSLISCAALSKAVDSMLVLCILGMPAANWFVFVYTPPEAEMGAVQKIFYFHVASAINAYLAIAVLLVSSLAYLASRSEIWDMLNEAATEAAFVLATIVLGTGMVWGHSSWNTWWRWEPRLLTFLILWLLLLSGLVLRHVLGETFGDSHRRRAACAVMGIISAVNVPVVVFSVKLLDQTQQLHPQVIARQGLTDPRFTHALGFAVIAVGLLTLLLAALTLVNSALRKELFYLRLENRDA